MDGGPDDPEHFPDDLPEQQALQVTRSQLWGRSSALGPCHDPSCHPRTAAARRLPPLLTPLANSALLLAPQVDQGLTPLQAVMEWAAEGNPPAQRVAYILSIPAAAAESSLEEARAVLLPLLSQLAFDDHPDVKQATAEVLGPLGELKIKKHQSGQGVRGGLQRQGQLPAPQQRAAPVGSSNAAAGSPHPHQQAARTRTSRHHLSPYPPCLPLLHLVPCCLPIPLCVPAPSTATATATATAAGPILASKDAEAGEAEGSADAMDLLVLAHRLLQDPERGVRGPRAGAWPAAGPAAAAGACIASCWAGEAYQLHASSAHCFLSRCPPPVSTPLPCFPFLTELLQIQESAASSVAMFAGLLSHEHRREHLTAVVDALMQDYEGGWVRAWVGGWVGRGGAPSPLVAMHAVQWSRTEA
jgi:hypothetical protein